MIEERGFQPDWASAPGETISDLLREHGLSASALGSRLDISEAEVLLLLNGTANLTPTTATHLEAVFGAPAEFWLTREYQYRADESRLQQRNDSLDEWIAEFPVKEMVDQRWIAPASSKEAQCESLLRFFGVHDIARWERRYGAVLAACSFRTSATFSSQRGAIAAWLRQGELVSENSACDAWDRDRFLDVLPHMRSLTRKRDPNAFVPELARLCGQCGVSLAVVRSPRGCRASGATRFITAKRALLLLSFRYLSDDHFWFTFFHEAGHLLLHKKTDLFFEGLEDGGGDEEAANKFASQILIPPAFEEDMLRLRPVARDVIRFAMHIGVSPGIVVGQLQYHGHFRFSQLNALRRRFDWSRLDI